MGQALAIKYRPHDWDNVVEQQSVKIILKQQIESGELRGAYLFVGSAGCGKTTCARIFANAINKGKGNPIEMDAASHNSVDDVREIIKMVQTGSMTSEYKVFILDEVQSLSNQAWQAMLKLIEEPPARAIFIMCTTDPQKIPKTILSRVQRYNFSKISQKAIVGRLNYILSQESVEDEIQADADAIEYLAKIADGGMRDAITLLDKVLAYDSRNLTVENIVKALNITDYTEYKDLTEYIYNSDKKNILEILDEIYSSGVDFKQFIKSYAQFVLDINKALIIERLDEVFKYISIPHTKENEKWLKQWNADDIEFFNSLLDTVIQLDADIKWSQSVKMDVEARLMLF